LIWEVIRGKKWREELGEEEEEVRKAGRRPEAVGV
jgi:hypothetical protein